MNGYTKKPPPSWARQGLLALPQSLDGVLVVLAPRDVDVVLIGRPVMGQALLGCFLLNPLNVVGSNSEKQGDWKANQRDCGRKQWKERIHLKRTDE